MSVIEIYRFIDSYRGGTQEIVFGLVGYSFFGGDTGTAYISGGIDLADHDKERETVDVKRFLDIERIAEASDSMPYVTALTDPVPWFRDLAAQRLVQSKACKNTPSCRQAFLSATRDLLRSSKYGDRQEGLHWTRASNRTNARRSQ